MTIKTYLLISSGLFVLIVTGADVSARMLVTGATLGMAIGGYRPWSSIAPVGLLMLFLPFIGLALLCGLTNRWAKTRYAMMLFWGTAVLLCGLYVDGFHSAERALRCGRWTEAALSIGLLPFLAFVPVLMLTACLAAAISWLGRRSASPT